MRHLILFIVLVTLIGCSTEKKIENKKAELDDLAKISKRGKLVALTGYNAYSYFIYRGQPMGYEYELVKRLADYLNVELELKIVKSIDKMIEMLEDGKGDLVAFNLTVTKDRMHRVAFTEYHNVTKQVLIQRKPENWFKFSRARLDREMIRNPFELIGKNIVVRESSSYKSRLKNLSNEIGGDVIIEEADSNYTTQDLIRLVSEGEIDYTIADENIAMLVQSYYRNIDYKTSISLPQRIAWAVSNNSTTLLDTINTWIRQMKKKTEYYVLYNKYYKSRNGFNRRYKSEYFANKSGKISRYDELIKVYADSLNWDWRLLASQIYQESRFNPNAKSWAGAKGLMQLMPATQEQFGVKNPDDPYESLDAGIRYIMWLDKYWSETIEDKQERIKFVLASYNIGPGHVKDAMRLAQKYKADSSKWSDNVESYLLNKSEKKFFNDEVVKYGYCRGIETVNYVREIFERYEHYKEIINDEEDKTG